MSESGQRVTVLLGLGLGFLRAAGKGQDSLVKSLAFRCLTSALFSGARGMDSVELLLLSSVFETDLPSIFRRELSRQFELSLRFIEESLLKFECFWLSEKGVDVWLFLCFEVVDGRFSWAKTVDLPGFYSSSKR